MNLRGCEQQGSGGWSIWTQGRPGIKKVVEPRSQGEEPAARPGFGANTSQTLVAKFRRGILGQQALGRRRGSLLSSAGCQQPAHRVPSPCAALFGVMDIPRGQQAGQGHQPAAGPGCAVTACHSASPRPPCQWQATALFNHSLANHFYSLPFSFCLLCWLGWRGGTSSFGKGAGDSVWHL